MQSKFQTPYNGKVYKRLHVPTRYGPSKTIPDQSMSVAELFARYTKGMPLGGNPKFVIDYDDENLPPDFDRMDLTEQQDWLLATKDELGEIRQRDTDRKKPKPKVEEKAPPASAEPAAPGTNTP